MEMLLLSEERECGKMKKKKIMFIILCMLTVLAAGTAHATEKERVDPLQPAIAEKILRFHVLANSDAKDDQNVKLKVRDAVGHMLGQKLKKVTDRAQTEKIVQDHMVLKHTLRCLEQTRHLVHGIRCGHSQTTLQQTQRVEWHGPRLAKLSMSSFRRL